MTDDRLERFSLLPEAAFTPSEDLLDGVTIAPLTPPLGAGAPVQAAVFRLAPGGSIRRHPATVPQILAVLEGSGTVRGSEGDPEPIAAGEAVFWRQGEEHETISLDGMTALVLEADGLSPPT
jgi:quercetin dioxygenase-like cupin family protein